MDELNNLYILSVKNKHMIPHAMFLVMGMIARRKASEISEDNVSYLGDNLPLDLVKRIKNA